MPASTAIHYYGTLGCHLEIDVSDLPMMHMAGSWLSCGLFGCGDRLNANHKFTNFSKHATTLRGNIPRSGRAPLVPSQPHAELASLLGTNGLIF